MINKRYIASYLKQIRREINDAIQLIDDNDTKRILRTANNSLLELKRGLKE